VRIERATDPAALVAASHLFDHPVDIEGARRFLEAPGHHLLLGVDDAGRAVGFVSGVETTHPDKGTEMFLYELAVDEGSRGQGVGTRLVAALGALAQELGCYGMWVSTDHDNLAAQRTYASAGATDAGSFLMLDWTYAAMERKRTEPTETTD
jgi:ribosomal protein S18 acetylase RimI-like enzyme